MKIEHANPLSIYDELNHWKLQYEMTAKERNELELKVAAFQDRYYEVCYELRKYVSDYKFKYWDEASYRAWLNRDMEININEESI